jgi:peptidoglycan/LPS O-acetylase OafA/YrhL
MNNRYDFLDALRGIAVLGVVTVHVLKFIVHTTNSGILYRLSGEGARGVQLFYIVSALTLFLSLHSSQYLGKVGETLKYSLRRFFRIAPMFYLMLIIIGFFTFIYPLDFFSYVKTDILNFVSSFTFINGFFPDYINNIVPGQWSIAVEMLFYILVPILFIRIKNLEGAKKAFLYSIIFTTLIELILPIISPNLNGGDLQFALFATLPIQLPTFILGFVSFFLIYNKDGKKESADKKTIIDTIKYLFAVTLIAEIIFIIVKFALLKTIDTSLTTPRIYIESVILVCLVISLANGYFSILKNKLFQFFGKISYSLYLTHFLILMLISRTALYIAMAKHMNIYVEYAFLFVLGTIIASVISYITYILIEKPGQELGKYVSKKLVKQD